MRRAASGSSYVFCQALRNRFPWRTKMHVVSGQFRGAWMTLALITAAALPAAAQAPEVNGGIGRAARPSVDDWVLANRQLRVLLRPDTLTLSVEDLSTHETWGSDPWENSAGRVYLRGKNGEALTVGLGTAAQKNIEELPSGAQGGPGLRISLSRDRKSTRLNSSHLGISY